MITLKNRDISLMMILILFPCYLLMTGCTHKPPSTISDSTAMTDAAGTEADIEGLDTGDDSGNGSESGDAASARNAGLSTRLLVDEARSLACTGAVQYKNGEFDEAIANFEAALLNLQLADLPEDMQSVAFFQPYLPDICRSVDLDKAYTSLQEASAREQLLLEEIPDAGDAFSQIDRAFIEMELKRFMEILGENCSNEEEMAIFADEVEDFINYFLTVKREWFERSYQRMIKYRQTIDRIMTEKRIPPELSYLAFVESGYMFRATSRSKARGIWQFMPSTGKHYGLKINRGVDERLDPVKSTIAAREYLLDLISIFGSESFLLAMASYNAGEGRVQKCLRGLEDPFENRSFWKIRECLHQETQEYIPRIIAAGILCENTKRFGLDLKTPEEILEEYDVVVCPGRVRLSSLAEVAGISVDELRELNPDLPSGGSWTPVTNMHLYVPKGNSESFETALHRMETAPEITYSETYHTVRHGETLSSIGRLYKIPYKKIAEWNNLSSPYRLKPGQKLAIQSPDTPARTSSSGTSSEPSAGSLVYTVKKGNYLAGIGALFGVSARDIMTLNNLRRGTIYPGQRLTVKPAYPVETIKHKISAGDTLYSIAKQYGVSSDAILFTNGFSSDRTLRIGGTITIYRRG